MGLHFLVVVERMNTERTLSMLDRCSKLHCENEWDRGQLTATRRGYIHLSRFFWT